VSKPVQDKGVKCRMNTKTMTGYLSGQRKAD